MQIKREEDNRAFTLITIKPWPDEPWAQDVTVLHHKYDPETGKQISEASVRYGQTPVSFGAAREFAEAILKACDIAERLEKEGTIILEGGGCPTGGAHER